MALFNLPKAVFLFGTDNHYTVVLTDRDKQRISFADSLMTKPSNTPWQVNMVLALFQDEADRQEKRDGFTTL